MFELYMGVFCLWVSICQYDSLALFISKYSYCTQVAKHQKTKKAEAFSLYQVHHFLKA